MGTANRTRISRDVYLELVRAHDRFSAEFTSLFREHGISSPQYNVLRILAGGPEEGTSCHAIRERLLTRVPDVTRLVDRMVASGIVHRERDTDNRRIVRVRITPAGRRLLRRLARPVDDLHARQFARIPVRDLAALRDALRSLQEQA